MKLPTGYSFVAAANLFQNYGGNAIYLKYKKSDVPGIHIKECGKHHIWYTTPDREIFMTRDTFANESVYPRGFDKCIDLNTFNDNACDGLGLQYVMTNYTHETFKNLGRGSVKEENKKVQILSDSGGLQLVRGVTGLIHPKNLVEFFNENADAGMILDIPLFVKSEKLMLRAAKLQKRNNDIMLAHSRKGLDLINVFHGSTVEDRKKFRDIVETDKIRRVAIGGLYRQKPVTFVNTIYELVEGGSFRYKQYHALGIYIVGYIMLLVKMANSGDNPPHITSDSTSHVQASNNYIYHLQPDEKHSMVRPSIGVKAGAYANPAMHLLCNCTICRNIKHRDILSFGTNRFAPFLALHNAIEMARYAHSLQEICRSVTPAEYNSYCFHQLKNSADKHDVKQALDFIDIVTQEGLKKAQKKYENHINRWKLGEEVPPSLFEDVKHEDSRYNKFYKQTEYLLDALEKQIKKD